jgi:hypothetical protein
MRAIPKCGKAEWHEFQRFPKCGNVKKNKYVQSPSVERLNGMNFNVSPSVETLKKTNACNFTKVIKQTDGDLNLSRALKKSKLNRLTISAPIIRATYPNFKTAARWVRLKASKLKAVYNFFLSVFVRTVRLIRVLFYF